MHELNYSKSVPVNLEDEMKRSYMDYAMSVIISRAIPDVRDGLKPVHRRILFAMHEAGYFAGKAHRKSARIVGDVIGKYHPHGDSAVYDSLVRMAQSFSLRAPLVDGQGNFGSIDGDTAAAMRYTESRLSKIAQMLLEDIDKDTVNFSPNYDGLEQEPNVLPAMFPNLLINGAGGIAVGMATNIPPHNLAEVIDACCLYIDNNDIEIHELLTAVKGPDFPTAGMILGKSGFQSAYLTGRGNVVIRGKHKIEGNDNKQAIIITELPYAINKAKLVEKIAELVRDKRIEGISDLRDESNKDGIRIVIEVRKGVNTEVILNQLYSYTSLQVNFGIIMLALDDGRPKIMNLKEIITAFVRFREIVITRRTIYLLNKARDKAHILLGIYIAVHNIDPVIKLIKESPSPAIAKERLMGKEWECADIVNLIKLVDDKTTIADDKIMLTESQAKSILEMRLQRLTAIEKDKIEQELAELGKEITKLIEILISRERLLFVLKNELLRVKEEFGTPRLTEINEHNFEHDIEDLIQREEMVVTVTYNGYIKRVPLATYKVQKRGGKGRSGLSMRDEDVTTQLFVANTHTPLLFFSNKGQVYRIKLYKLPLGNPQSKGRPIINILSLKEGEIINNIMPMPEDETRWNDLSIIFATAEGNIRRNNLSDFRNIPTNGKIAIRMSADDSLISVKLCKEENSILLATKYGKAVHFPVTAIRTFKSRTSSGVRAVRLVKGDEVISMTILCGMKYSPENREAYLTIPFEQRRKIAKGDTDFTPELLNSSLSKEQIIDMAKAEEFILTITENGYGKRTSAYHYRIAHRGGKGIINMITSDKTGAAITVMPTNINDEIMLITNAGQLIRCGLDSLRVTGRSTSGVILFKTALEEKVVSASIINEDTAKEDELKEDDLREDELGEDKPVEG